MPRARTHVEDTYAPAVEDALQNEVLIQAPRPANTMPMEAQVPAMQAAATPAAMPMSAPEAASKQKRRSLAKHIRAFLRLCFRAIKAVYTYIYEP